MKTDMHNQPTSEYPRGPINDNEWNFSSCPKNQWPWCDKYEHCRSNQTVVDAVRHHREKGIWPCDWASRFRDQACQEMAEKLFALFPEFPSKPFLDIDEKLRADRCVVLDRLQEKLAVRVCDSRVDNAPQDIVFQFVVAPCASRKHLEAALGRMPKLNLQGRRHLTAQLVALGIWRLYSHFDDWGLVIKHAKSPRCARSLAPKFSDRPENLSQWSRAKGKAEKAIRGVLSADW